MKKLSILLIIFFQFFSTAQPQEVIDFPWQVTAIKHGDLSPEHKQIYLNAYFETMIFILYSYLDKNDPDAMKYLNGFIDCIDETNDLKQWSPKIGWIWGDDLDKSAAYILYNKVTSIVCKNYLNEAVDTQAKTLRIYRYSDWEKWSNKDKTIYMSGYIDTTATFFMRMGNAGEKKDIKNLLTVIEKEGVGGVLSNIKLADLKQGNPLPWAMAYALGRTRNKVISK